MMHKIDPNQSRGRNMRGRRVLMESFVSHGVRHIFGNPGTTETPLLDSLPAFPQIEYIMALHEGVAVSAASFYAQASGRVTVANLHVAPGLGNGIGSLYGALKANSPVVVTAGQQDTRMRLRESGARPRPRGDGGAGDQVERADRARRRDRADHAARVQGGDRRATGAGFRSAADRRPGTGNRRSRHRRRTICGDRRGPIRRASKHWPRCF